MLVFTVTLQAQERIHSTFYYQRATLFDQLPVHPDDIIMLGNSITNGCEWAELFDNPHVKNRGISGDTAMGVYDRLGSVLKGNPAKIFLMIGVNDISHDLTADSIVKDITRVVEKIMHDSPRTRLYLQSLLPMNPDFPRFENTTRRMDVLLAVNERLVRLAADKKIKYIDLCPLFADPQTGKLKAEYTNDGLHLLGPAYLLWRDKLLPYIAE